MVIKIIYITLSYGNESVELITSDFRIQITLSTTTVMRLINGCSHRPKLLAVRLCDWYLVFVFPDELVSLDIGINIKHVMVLSVVELCCIVVRRPVLGRHLLFCCSCRKSERSCNTANCSLFSPIVCSLNDNN